MDAREVFLAHHGILGQKWGRKNGPPYPLDASDHSAAEIKAGWRKSLDGGGNKKPQYRSTSLRSYMARRRNEKIDKSFEKWKEGSKARAEAIAVGKRRNDLKFEYENNPSKENKASLKRAEKEYKKALRNNTLYRQGQVKSEVEGDVARRHLSEAKKVAKQLETDPDNKELRKKYSDLMNKHDVEREKARRAPSVGENRSRRKAAIKRTLNMGIKSAAATAAVGAGTYAVNKYLSNKGYGSIASDNVINAVNTIENLANIGMKYFY